jgi:hypothetical protein
MNDASIKIESKTTSKPAAEILVEGELSPFEHEALYQLLRKHFLVEHPVYKELEDETIGTRVNLIFHHSYNREFFTEVFRNGWRDLKSLFKQISYRRGRLGASFNLSFSEPKCRLTFSTGQPDDQALGSAMDQLAHLTAVIGQMFRPETMSEPLGQVDARYDKRSDRWQDFHSVGLTDKRSYFFDESSFRWKPTV